MRAVLLLLLVALCCADPECRYDDQDRWPCSSYNYRCTLQQPAALCKGDIFEIVPPTRSLYDQWFASGATVYKCCDGAACECDGESDCFSKWSIAEDLPTFYKRASTYQTGRSRIANNGWRINSAGLTASESVAQCYFNIFWCGTCSQGSRESDCGGHQTACGFGQPEPCNATDKCGPNCPGFELWSGDWDEAEKGAVQLNYVFAVTQHPLNLEVLASASQAQFVASFDGCSLDTTSWYECPSSGTCNPGDGSRVSSSLVTETGSAGDRTSTLTLSTLVNGNRYYALACPASCGGTCDASCDRAYITNVATLTVCGSVGTPPSIQTQPSPQQVNVEIGLGNQVTFTAAASGASSVRWQVSSDDVSFTDFLAGSFDGTTATLTFTPDASHDAKFFRALFDSCTATTPSASVSLCARLAPCMYSINAVSINEGWNATLCTTHLASATNFNPNLCVNGASSAFGSTAGQCDPNPPTEVFWERQPESGGSFVAMSGPITGLPLTAQGQTTASYYGSDYREDPYFRVRVGNCAASRTSNTERVTVNCPDGTQGVDTAPVDVSVDTNQGFTLTARAEENPSYGYPSSGYWQVSTDFGSSWSGVGGSYTESMSGAVSTLTFTGATTVAMHGYRYRVRFCNCRNRRDSDTDCSDSTASAAAALTVLCPGACAPRILQSPQDVRSIVGQVATFTASVIDNSAANPQTVQWFYRPSGGSWAAVSTGGDFAVSGNGVSSTLTISDLTASNDNADVRATFTNDVDSVTTASAELRVDTLPDTCSQECDESETYGDSSLTEDCGSEPSGCTFNCPACGSCTQSANPVFSKQCEASIVLVLDESGSIGPYESDVRNGVKQFLLSFAGTSALGGTANLGVVEFDDVARLVTTSNNDGKMASLTTAWVNALSGYVDNTAGGDDDSGYNSGGCTNWGEALELALRPSGASSSWQVYDGTSWVNQNPDVVLFFTDGRPTSHPPNKCDWHCNFARTRPNGNIVGPCNGGDVGTGCYRADLLKKAGVKIFLVGVGGVSNHIGNVELVTGTNVWDLESSSFPTSDYVVDVDFAALGNLFLEVVRGLCSCLQQTTSCEGTAAQCQARLFSARIQVTTSSDSVSTTYAPGSVQAGYIYYRYEPSPDTRVGYQFFGPMDDVTTASPTIIRTDTQDPCTVQRQVRCGGGCFAVSERQEIPRFFRESSDTAGADGAFWPMPTACNLGFTKVYASPPSADSTLVKYLYVLSDGVTPCAAEAFDKTLFEFFSDAGVTAGVSDLGSTPQVIMPNVLPAGDYSFELNSSCTVATCGRDIELVIVVDESAAVSFTDFSNMLSFLRLTVDTFNLDSAGVRFGIYWSNSSPVSSEGLRPIGANLITNVLTPAGHAQSGGTADFAALGVSAIDFFWPSTEPPTGISRVLLTLVASNDAGTDPNRFTAFQNKLVQRNVEAFSVGVGDVGAYLTPLLVNLSSANINFVHYQSFASSSFLVEDYQQVAPLLCPQGNLCGNCAGFCECASIDSCTCPSCRQTACLTRDCPDPISGCLVTNTLSCDDGRGNCTNKICVDPTGGCTFPEAVTCNDTDPCTEDVCLPSGECSYTRINVEDGLFCTINECLADGTISTTPRDCGQSDACVIRFCNETSRACELRPAVVCENNDRCTINSCNTTTGCVYTAVSDPPPIDVCPSQSCKIARCVPFSNDCTYRNDDSVACACELYPCTDETFCTRPKCFDNILNQCADLPTVAERNACEAALVNTAGDPKRFCYDEPKAVCEPTNECFNISCVNTGGTAGFCQAVATGDRCIADLCNIASCDNTTGCEVRRKDDDDIRAICNDDNECTEDTCSNGACVYTDTSASCTNNGDKCKVGFCDSAIGCRTRPLNGTELPQVCNDGNACTIDTCADNVCSYDLDQLRCDPDDACRSSVCNATTGLCDVTVAVCDDDNECTKDDCNVTTGCVYTPLTQQEINDVCKPGNCNVAVCNTTRCDLSPIVPTPVVCGGNPCAVSPCPNPVDTFCELTVCIRSVDASGGDAFSCDSIGNVTERAECVAALVTPTDRYCYILDRDPCSSQNTKCTNFTCNAAESKCDEVDIGALCPGSFCRDPTCNQDLGCGYTDKPADIITSLCDDNNECTIDTCANDMCVYTNRSCVTNDKCLDVSCDPTVIGGCVFKEKTGDALRAVCDDSNACTVDTCVDNQCYYTPTEQSKCNPSDNCTTWQCNPTTGLCESTTQDCDDLNKCTADSCDGAVLGGCVHTLITDPLELAGVLVCDTPSCQIAQCSLANNGTCSFSLSQTEDCACINYPCLNDQYCSDPVCYTNATCGELSGADEVACRAAVANASAPFYNRFCYDRDSAEKLACEARTGKCTQYMCVNGADATTGTCEASPTGLTCDSPDKCNFGRCDEAAGCQFFRHNNTFLSELCNDNNACTEDTCWNDQCLYNDTSSSCDVADDKCIVGFCDSASGCRTRPLNQTELNSVCNDQNQCTKDSCSDNTCRYEIDVVCDADDACNSYSCNATTGQCDLTETVCDDMNPCTIDTCNVTLGGCVYTPRTQDQVNQLCGPQSCQNATCETACVITNITEGVCSNNPCEANPCPGPMIDNFCERSVCINALTGSGITCDSVVEAGQESICRNNITSGGRFCYLLDNDPCTARNTACTLFSCNATSSDCDATTDLGALCPDTDICKRPICNDQTGCGFQNLSSTEVELLCNDFDECTADTCENGACKYTPIGDQCPDSTDLCREKVCDPLLGCGTQRKNASVIAEICDDSNACTADDCVGGRCVYTPIQDCGASNTACATFVCNAITGQCEEDTRTVCNDTNICTEDTCNATTGCVYTPLSQVQVDALCAPGDCKVATCDALANRCVVVSDNSTQCACAEYPCSNVDTFCTTARCVNSVTGCNALPLALQADCLAALVDVPRRYCADIPRNRCPRDTNCTTYSCTVNASDVTQGSCDATDIGALCTSSDICKRPDCDDTDGCIEVLKSVDEIQTLCNDMDACTIDTCEDGACKYTPRVCPTSMDMCEEAFCDSVSGCGFRKKNATVLAELCNDSNACTKDTCDNNQCSYDVDVDCPPSDLCEQYACNAVTGRCDKTETQCDDSNPCTRDSCNGTSGCVYTPLSQVEINALCAPGSCEQATCVTGCVNVPIVPVPQACNSDPCVRNPCETYISTFCEETVCINQVNGSAAFTCESLPEPERSACIFNVTTDTTVERYCYDRLLSPCPTNTSCTGYTCNPAGTGSCDETDFGASCPDTDICKRPICNDNTGCGFQNKSATEIATLCDDNDFCTEDTCESGACKYTPVGNQCPQPTDMCLERVCDPNSGCGTRRKNASVIAALCNDDNACTSDDCVDGRCVYEQSVFCLPDNACVQYSCNPLTGSCDETRLVCDDDNACTVDTCNTTTGCVYTPITCNDNNACTFDSCNVTTGCVYSNITCPTDACTNAVCLPSVGCRNSSIVCDDNSFLTVDSCNATQGCVYTPIGCPFVNNCTLSTLTPNGCELSNRTCDDGNPCTIDSCDNVAGCQYVAKNCSSPDPCQVGSCSFSGECLYADKECTDDDPCTTDSCAPDGTCIHTPITCANISRCFNYVCNATGSTYECVKDSDVNCDDNDSCTIDSCEEAIGCKHLDVICLSTTECNFPNGCIGTGAEPVCTYVNITSLFDFCGNCQGDNTECFFSSALGTEAVVGISAGVAVAIAVAAVIACLIAFFATRKGYAYYKAKSDAAAASMQTNPYFKNNTLQGEMM